MKALVSMPDHSLLTLIFEGMHAFVRLSRGCAIDYSDVYCHLTHKLN